MRSDGVPERDTQSSYVEEYLKNVEDVGYSGKAEGLVGSHHMGSFKIPFKSCLESLHLTVQWGICRSLRQRIHLYVM